MEVSKTNQTRWEWHHNAFTPSLHLVPFCQLCTPQNSLHALSLFHMHWIFFKPVLKVMYIVNSCLTLPLNTEWSEPLSYLHHWPLMSILGCGYARSNENLMLRSRAHALGGWSWRAIARVQRQLPGVEVAGVEATEIEAHMATYFLFATDH